MPELNEPAARTTPYKPQIQAQREIQNKTIVISTDNDKDEQDCWPVSVPASRKSRKPAPVVDNDDEIIVVPRTPSPQVKTINKVGGGSVGSKSRFQSPPNLPPFYSQALKKSQKKSTETQTTSPCIVVQKKNVVRRRDLVKSKSPEPQEHSTTKHMTQQVIMHLIFILETRRLLFTLNPQNKRENSIQQL